MRKNQKNLHKEEKTMNETKFNVSDNLNLPHECITWVNSFLAKRGAGKTYNAAVLAEEMLKANVPIVVIDGMGIWWGLRVGKNGQGDGLPIVVFGGEHADIPLDPLKAKQIAKAIVETNISAVLDLSGYSKLASRRIVAEFLDELYKINRLERHIFIEEADLWAPQRVIGLEQAQCLGAVDNFVRRGGNHNLGCSLITQRSAVLNKDLLTQSDCLFILRTLAPQDKKAIQAWVEEQTDEDRHKLNEWYDSLKSLKNGEVWVWHPERPAIFKKVMFRQRQTFHATRMFLLSPKAQKIKLMDVDEFVQKFKDRFEPKPKEISKPVQPIQQVSKSQIMMQPQTPFIQPQVQPTRQMQSEEEAAEIKVRKTEPMIVLEKYKPTINILSEASTPLGRLVVILANKFNGRNDKWSIKNIKNQVERHAWDVDGIEHEIDRLIQWEILEFQSNGLLRFYPDRVRVVENQMNLGENMEMLT
jgi:hypothetical protein